LWAGIAGIVDRKEGIFRERGQRALGRQKEHNAMRMLDAHLIELLGKVKIFRLLDENQLRKIGGVVHEQRFSAGQTICEQGDSGDYLFILVDGIVRIYLLSPDGREMTIRVYGRGDTFGEFAVLDGKPRAANAIAVSDVVTMVIYRHEFLDLMRNSFDLVMRVMEELTERLRFTTRFTQNLAFLTASGRIAAALTELARQQASGSAIVRLPMTQQGLANYANVTREWTNKALRVLAEQGVVRVERGAITLLDLERLRYWGEN
jgi:CRP-like cAMP-binding protein